MEHLVQSLELLFEMVSLQANLSLSALVTGDHLVETLVSAHEQFLFQETLFRLLDLVELVRGHLSLRSSDHAHSSILRLFWREFCFCD